MAPAVPHPQQPQMVDTTCGSLLRELQHIWDEVGESDGERDKMLLQLEQECLEVYRRKVDQANHARARLHQALADTETELASLYSLLGDRPAHTRPEKRNGTLKDQVAASAPELEELRQKKEERLQQIMDVRREIQKISAEISGSMQSVGDDDPSFTPSQNLSLKRLEEYQAQLQALQKEKSERLHRVLQCVDKVHELSALLGLDFFKVLSEVHPSLNDESSEGQCKSISNSTLRRVTDSIQSLEEEKARRMEKLHDLGTRLTDLWNLMDTPAEEQQLFHHITSIAAAPGALAFDVIEEAEVEVERLERLKATKLKEIVLKRRTELEEICRQAHMEPDRSTAEDKTNALIESGMVDPSELLASIEEQIAKSREEASSRRDILDRIEKWMAACEEESWLEDYSKDENRYSASRGAHINLKRAERARATVSKLPGLLELLNSKTRAWEEERGSPFLYDGVRLLAMLEEYNFLRQEKEEEKRRVRDHKRLQEQLMNEQETLFGSRPSPMKPVNAGSKKAPGGLRVNGSHPSTPANRRLSVGGTATGMLNADLPTPRASGGTPSSKLGKERPRPAAPVNYVALPKEDAPYHPCSQEVAAAAPVSWNEQQSSSEA